MTSQGHAVQDCNLPAKNIHFHILPNDAAKSSNMYKHLSETWWHSKQTWLLEPLSLEPALLAGSGAAQSSSIHACDHIWGLGRLSTKHRDTHTEIYSISHYILEKVAGISGVQRRGVFSHSYFSPFRPKYKPHKRHSAPRHALRLS